MAAQNMSVKKAINTGNRGCLCRWFLESYTNCRTSADIMPQAATVTAPPYLPQCVELSMLNKRVVCMSARHVLPRRIFDTSSM